MGDHQSGSPRPHGFSTEDRLFPLSSSSPLVLSSSLSNPDSLSISDDCWLRAERATHEIICQIQPSLVSEHKRKAVIDHVQNLIRFYLGSEVFPFGSVPLKTYLPDGDIDLTAICTQNVEDALANDVRSVLEVEEQNEAAEFEVKDVQYIHAEVKLIKCLVQNIVVDISFNQIGGLCTLCFLEQVDRLIGKDHLFKRSIILIKAWCYYESRILGAHHGLISTYALETLVLYIFHLFHSSLDGPLAVLYKFLDYFSKFDWDNYCISLNGPVCISSLPEIVAETPDNGGGDLLLSKGFLRNCVDMFSVPSRGLESNSRAFPQKHFNIVDPLKENNNLGRSVSKGNFYRIRSAFAYGARKLSRILVLPVGSVADELNKFFGNTLYRDGRGQRPDVKDHVPTFGTNGPCSENTMYRDGRGQRPDVKDHVPTFGTNGPCSASLMPGIEKYPEEKTVPGSPSVDFNGTRGAWESRVDPKGLLCKEISGILISPGSERKPSTGISNESQRCTIRFGSSTVLEIDGFANGNAPSGCLSGDGEDLATSRTQRPRVTIEKPESTRCNEPGNSPLGRANHSPHLYFSNLCTEKGNSDQATNSSVLENNVSSRLLGPPDEVTGPVLRKDPEETELSTNYTTHSPKNYKHPATVDTADGSSSIGYPMEDSCLGYREGDSASTAESPEHLNSLSDLSGEYDIHFKELLYARWCHEYVLSGSVVPIAPSPSQFRKKHALTFHQSMQLNRSVFPHMNVNGVAPGSHFYQVNPLIMPGSYGAEEVPKPRGTGTYFPNTNHRSYRDRSMPGRGRISSPVMHGQFRRPPRENGWPATSPEANLFEKGIHEPLQAQLPVFPVRGKPGPLDFFQGGRPGFSHANGFALQSERLEFGSPGHLSGSPLPETSRQPVFGTLPTQGSTTSLPALQRPRSVSGVNPEGIAIQSYQLKDETDFPPLSV